MSSTRLPGKVLADLAGEPLIQRVFERTRASQLVDDVVVLTSVETSDDPLAAECERRRIPLIRGPLEDVTARYEELADRYDPDVIVRITGDCPLVSPEFIDLQIQALREFDGDFVRVDSGELIEGSLGGQSVFSTRAFRIGAQSDDPLDREHVASFFFRRNAALFRFVQTSVDPVYFAPGLRLCVDQPKDLAFVRAIYDHFADRSAEPFALADVLRWLAVNPELRRINDSVLMSDANQRLQSMPLDESIQIVGRWAA